MIDVLKMQTDDDPDASAEPKQSNVSYSVCRNSRASQLFCIRP